MTDELFLEQINALPVESRIILWNFAIDLVSSPPKTKTPEPKSGLNFISLSKLRKIAFESFINGLRLHFDSILLYENSSLPSAMQLSILSLEEFGKTEWVHHLYWTKSVHDDKPVNERDEEYMKDEQKLLNLLYSHSKKQQWLINRTLFLEASPQLFELVNSGQLDLKKQKATYVGLEKKKNYVDVKSTVSLPKQIGKQETKQMISLINDYLKDQCERKLIQEGLYDIQEIDEVLTEELLQKLNQWNFKSKKLYSKFGFKK